jgi:hypothetical protein
MSQSRQLAAIMFTNIAGYSKLIRRDSNKALELVRVSKDIQNHLVEGQNSQAVMEYWH